MSSINTPARAYDKKRELSSPDFDIDNKKRRYPPLLIHLTDNTAAYIANMDQSVTASNNMNVTRADMEGIASVLEETFESRIAIMVQKIVDGLA